MIVLRKIFTKAQDEDFVNDLKEKAEKKIKVDRRLKKAKNFRKESNIWQEGKSGLHCRQSVTLGSYFRRCLSRK